MHATACQPGALAFAAAIVSINNHLAIQTPALLPAGCRCFSHSADNHAGVEAAVREHKPKVVFLTSPNNPDGSLISEVRFARALELAVQWPQPRTMAAATHLPRGSGQGSRALNVGRL